MKNSGFLLRFIDIGLIILFGFLIISDINSFTYIDMPGSSQNKTATDPQEMTFVSVSISPRNMFTVEVRESGRVPCSNVEKGGLEECLVEVESSLSRQGQRAIVLVQPSEASMVQRTVDVLDICDKHGILKNINVSGLKL